MLAPEPTPRGVDDAATPTVARSATEASAPPPAPAPRSGDAEPAVPVTIEPSPPRPGLRPLVGRLTVARSERNAQAGDSPLPDAGPRPKPPAEPRPPLDAVLASLAGGPATAGIQPAWAGIAADSPTTVSRSAAVEDGTPASTHTPPRFGSAMAGGAPAQPESLDGAVVARSIGAARSVDRTSGSAGTPASGAGIADAASWQPPIRRVAVATPSRSGAPASPALATGTAQRAVTEPAAVRAAQRSVIQPSLPALHPPDEAMSAVPGAHAGGASASGTRAPLQRSMVAPEAAPPLAPLSIGPIVSRQAGEGDAAETGSPEGAATPGAGSDKELDELARKLFPRLQLRLRNELLVDRERIGALVDFGR